MLDIEIDHIQRVVQKISKGEPLDGLVDPLPGPVLIEFPGTAISKGSGRVAVIEPDRPPIITVLIDYALYGIVLVCGIVIGSVVTLLY